MRRRAPAEAGRALAPAAAAMVALILLAVTALAAPARAVVTSQEVEEARQRLRAVTSQLQGEVTRYEEALLEESLLRERITRIRVDLTGRERELALARTAARARVAEMYMAAGSGGTISLLGGGDGRGPARLAYLDSVALTDREVVNRLEQARRDFGRQQDLLTATLADQERVSAELSELVDGIYAELEAADREYRTVKQEWDLQEAERIRREEEERRRREWLATSTTTAATTTTAGGGEPGTTTTAPAPITTTTTLPPAPPGTLVCPVDGATTFRDSWGEPRPGGRTHTGVDMMATLGTPLVAIENGVIYNPNWHYAGGIGLYIKGDSGDSWYYAHLNGYAAGIQAGTRVAAGQLVGYVGETGNAASPHLHLARILSGGQYVNPYPVVAEIC
ncbi:MAG: M23 family metallopeptidase [Acidimicrobiia bacterium]|nr:M23 family metallopeptidase [Acidimicrobiia bacterium]